MGREFLTLTEQLKEQLRLLESKRSEVENELLLNIEALPSDPGMTGPLVDREGYPRADIDIPLVRQLRQKINSKTVPHDGRLFSYFLLDAHTLTAQVMQNLP